MSHPGTKLFRPRGFKLVTYCPKCGKPMNVGEPCPWCSYVEEKKHQ